MAKDYYYFVSGLPNIHPEDSKLIMTPLMFLHAAHEHLNNEDYSLLRLLLLPNDIQNLVSTVHNENNWSDDSIITQDEWLEAIKALKQKTEPSFLNESLFQNNLPPFMLEYMSTEVQMLELKNPALMLRDLFTLLYDWIDLNGDGFIKDWFKFDSELKNIIIALNCRKHNVPLQEQLIGNSYLTSKLLKSSAGDFGLGNEFPIFEAISRLNDAPDIINKEKGFDALLWKWLDTRTFFDYFSIPRIMGYFIKIRIIYRWIHLSQAVGEKRFHKILHDLETSFEFPEEFALNKR